MSRKLPPPTGPRPEDDDQQDYLLDMIEQLADLAREIGEIEVAIHLNATAEVRRYTLGKRQT